MSDSFAAEAATDLLDRLIRVENALFCLKAKSKVFPVWDNAEVERLERLRIELLARCQDLSHQNRVIAG
jgi:hypothetical protein